MDGVVSRINLHVKGASKSTLKSRREGGIGRGVEEGAGRVLSATRVVSWVEGTGDIAGEDGACS